MRVAVIPKCHFLSRLSHLRLPRRSRRCSNLISQAWGYKRRRAPAPLSLADLEGHGLWRGVKHRPGQPP
jgi:hypothetical protein